MSAPDFAALSEKFEIREDVLENLHEEYLAEQETFNSDEFEEITFEEFLIEKFAWAAYVFAAINGEGIVECLEAFDETYEALEAAE